VHLRAVERGKWSGGYLNSFSLSTASPLREATNSLEKAVALLRSWVQIIPPCPFLNVRKLRYCFELVLDYWRTNSAVI
jgi:hypothetical protein